ncbi:hypothetical protein Ahia01_000230600 [Argonauta hians]
MDRDRPMFNFSPVSDKTAHLLSEPGQQPRYEIPASMNQYLRDYQREGVSFLLGHYLNNAGAILADDMGLGKTIQIIAFISALLGKTGTREDGHVLKPAFIRKLYCEGETVPGQQCRPFLIITPGSVLYNWQAELDTWGYFAVGKYHGKYKEECSTGMKYDRFEIVLTTFETFRDNKVYLTGFDWAAVIVDEVHKIKELKSQITQALRSFQCLRRYGLTGTALQNNMMELWSIIDWARPGFLGDQKEFHEGHVHYIMLGQKHDATKRELAEARQAKQKFCELRNQIMIRRTKDVIKDQLPNKDDNIVFCKLSDVQRKLHDAISQNEDFQNILKAAQLCSCGSGKIRTKCCAKKSGQNRSLIFQFLHLLLKVANHPGLLVSAARKPSSSSAGARKSAKFQQIQSEIFQSSPVYQQLQEKSLLSLSSSKYCGKMKVLKELLDIFHRKQSKVLLFSYRTQLLDLLEVYLKVSVYSFRRIDGAVSCKRRTDIVQEFNSDPTIFLCLISTRAGGIGLNITGANVVIIFDPNWNPSHDLQAQDRAYRIGQQRDVQVFRLISSASIEENIYLRQVYKQQLEKVAVGTENAKRYFFGIQGDQRRHGELFGLNNMFTFSEKQSCLVKNILERNNKVEKQLAGHQVTKYVPIVRAGRGGSPGLERGSEEEEEDDDFDIDDHSEDDDDDDEGGNYIDSDCNDDDDDDEEEEEDGQTGSLSTARPAPQRDAPPGYKDLGDYGVVHVHRNRQVTGGSRAEDHMSKRAMEEVLNKHTNSQQLAMDCLPYTQTPPDSSKSGRKRKKMTRLKDLNLPEYLPFGRHRMVFGETPVAVVRDHLNKMVASLEYCSAIELCQSIVRMSATERTQVLRQFYLNMYGPRLSGVLQKIPLFMQTPQAPGSDDDDDEEEDEDGPQNKLKRNHGVSPRRKDLQSPGRCSETPERCQNKSFRARNWPKLKLVSGKSAAHPARSSASTSNTSRNIFKPQEHLESELTAIPSEKLHSSTKKAHHKNRPRSSSPAPELVSKTDSEIFEHQKHLESNRTILSDSLPSSKVTNHKKPPGAQELGTTTDSKSEIFTEADDIFSSKPDQTISLHKPPPKAKFKSKHRNRTQTLTTGSTVPSTSE